jgi:hypothetical protein
VRISHYLEVDLIDGRIVFYAQSPRIPEIMVQVPSLDPYLKGDGALFSRGTVYRYMLWRVWDTSRPLLNWLLLNPSTADHKTDDNTMKKCTKFARTWGYGGQITTNIFAYRSTQPGFLKIIPDPVGPLNIAALGLAARSCQRVICGWGQWGRVNDRGNEVLALLREKGVEPWIMRMGANGQPWHPLYLPDNSHPIKWPS